MTASSDSQLQQAQNRSLVQAIESDDYDAVMTAILSGADVRHDNDMPICIAAGLGRTAMVQLLLEAGADHSVHDHKPLRDAQDNGFHETASILRRAGSYNPLVRGDFERSVAERVARQTCAADRNADFETVRDDALRTFEAQKHPGPLKP